MTSVWFYVVGGIAIGVGIQGDAPTSSIVQWAGIGVPLYANIARVLPITEALVNQGMSSP
ncbi:MAG: hypothetical protein ACM37W_16040 [Actinomycetota bacterium]